MVFKQGLQLTEFLGFKYTSKGVAQTSLLSLLPIYSKPSLEVLSSLQRRTSPHAERAGDISPTEDEPALKAVMFKKIQR
jgi:hypothetical protein